MPRRSGGGEFSWIPTNVPFQFFFSCMCEPPPTIAMDIFVSPPEEEESPLVPQVQPKKRANTYHGNTQGDEPWFCWDPNGNDSCMLPVDSYKSNDLSCIIRRDFLLSVQPIYNPVVIFHAS